MLRNMMSHPDINKTVYCSDYCCEYQRSDFFLLATYVGRRVIGHIYGSERTQITFIVSLIFALSISGGGSSCMIIITCYRRYEWLLLSEAKLKTALPCSCIHVSLRVAYWQKQRCQMGVWIDLLSTADVFTVRLRDLRFWSTVNLKVTQERHIICSVICDRIQRQRWEGTPGHYGD